MIKQASPLLRFTSVTTGTQDTFWALAAVYAAWAKTDGTSAAIKQSRTAPISHDHLSCVISAHEAHKKRTRYLRFACAMQTWVGAMHHRHRLHRQWPSSVCGHRNHGSSPPPRPHTCADRGNGRALACGYVVTCCIA